MANNKNKLELLEQVIVSEARDNFLSGEFREELHSGGKTPAIKLELTSEDILYRLCTQKGIDFNDFCYSFDWFGQSNKIYIVSRRFDANLELLKGMPHKKIIRAFKNYSDNFRHFSYEFSGYEICFLSYFEQLEPKIYYGKALTRKIAQSGIFDDENFKGNPLYCAAMYKTDHRS